MSPVRRTARSLPVVLLGLALVACGGDSTSEPTTILSDADGIVGLDESGGAEEGADASDEGQDATVEEQVPAGPAGTVTVDDVDHELAHIERCVPSDQMADHIEGLTGIESLETLNLVADGDTGAFQMYFSEIGAFSLSLHWTGDEVSLEKSFGKLALDDDWIDGEGGAVASEEPLRVVDGAAVGDVTIDGHDLSFRLPIPAEPTC